MTGADIDLYSVLGSITRLFCKNQPEEHLQSSPLPLTLLYLPQWIRSLSGSQPIPQARDQASLRMPVFAVRSCR